MHGSGKLVWLDVTCHLHAVPVRKTVHIGKGNSCSSDLISCINLYNEEAF